MGLYYRFTNRTTREYVDLDDASDRGRKLGAAVCCGPILAWLMSRDWRGDEVIVSNDSSDDWDTEDERGYTNVTAKAIDRMRAEIPFYDELGIRDRRLASERQRIPITPSDPARSLPLDTCQTRAVQGSPMTESSGPDTPGTDATSASASPQPIGGAVPTLIAAELAKAGSALRSEALRFYEQGKEHGRSIVRLELAAKLAERMLELASASESLAELRYRMRTVTDPAELVELLRKSIEAAQQAGYRAGHNDATLEIIRALTNGEI